jgi:hypothetical protein
MEPVFSIGVKSSLTKPKRKFKKSKSKIYIFTPILEFKVYSGPRWIRPSNVSKSIAYKYSSLDTIQTYGKIRNQIQRNKSEMRFTCFNTLYQWKPPQQVASAIQSYYSKQENEWNRVRHTYFNIFTLKRKIKTLIFRWKLRNCLRNVKNTEDPVTMDIPKKLVRIVDFKGGMSFVYEASTLRKTIESRILLSDYMFPEPDNPLNVLTNMPFTYGQLISVIRQCKQHNETSWILEGLKHTKYDLKLFIAYYKKQLKVEAIKAFFKSAVYLLQETVVDYFTNEAEKAFIPEVKIDNFIDAYTNRPDMPIIKQWISHTRDFYIAKELQDTILLINQVVRTQTLLNNVSRVFS